MVWSGSGEARSKGVPIMGVYYALAVAATILGVLTFSVFARLEHSIRVRWSDKYNGKE